MLSRPISVHHIGALANWHIGTTLVNTHTDSGVIRARLVGSDNGVLGAETNTHTAGVVMRSRSPVPHYGMSYHIVVCYVSAHWGGGSRYELPMLVRTG